LAIAVALLATGLLLGASAQRRDLLITTATTGGSYYPIGVGMAEIWSRALAPQNIRVSAQSSAGSVENINIMRNNEAEIAILQGLIGGMAYQGTDVFQGRPYTELRSIMSLWPNVEHFVLARSAVTTGTIEDIRGKRFSVGAAASGTEQSTVAIMTSLGIARTDITEEFLGYNPTADAMKDRRIDGGSLPAGPPVPAVTDLFATPGFQAVVLRITPAQLARVDQRYPGVWFQYTLPPGTYPNQTEPIQTIAQQNFLGIIAGVDEQTGYLLTKALWDNLAAFRAVHPAVSTVQFETALDGLPAPLHPGAVRYYRERGVNVPARLLPPGMN
jgi:TRAP transporter TAXI family solute receptor